MGFNLLNVTQLMGNINMPSFLASIENFEFNIDVMTSYKNVTI